MARDRHLKSPALGRHRHSSSSQRVTTAGLTCEITFPIPEITAGTFPGLAPDRNVTVSNLSPQTKSGVASHGASWWVDDEPLAAADLVTPPRRGCYAVLGPVGTVGAARALIDKHEFDSAFFDANLGGHSRRRW